MMQNYLLEDLLCKFLGVVDVANPPNEQVVANRVPIDEARTCKREDCSLTQSTLEQRVIFHNFHRPLAYSMCLNMDPAKRPVKYNLPQAPYLHNQAQAGCSCRWRSKMKAEVAELGLATKWSFDADSCHDESQKSCRSHEAIECT